MANLSWILKLCKKFPPTEYAYAYIVPLKNLNPNIFVNRIQDCLNLLPSFEKFSDFAVYRVQS